MKANPDMAALLQALRAARARRIRSPLQAVPGKGTNEAGPKVQTNAPPNEWPTDGDHD